MEMPPPILVDVPTLLERSRPRPRAAWMAFAAGGGILAMLAMSMASDRSAESRQDMEVLAGFLMMLLVGGMYLTNYLQARAGRIEQARLEAAEELMQLRRWPQAALLLQSLLSRPTRSAVGRLQALAYLSNVLMRFHRFDEVLAIDEHLLESMPPEAPAVHVVKLARATALLRQDRLYDADRAISDLRRSPHAAESAGLAVLEMYRDVKTGHAAETLEVFAHKCDLIRRQLGHRVADAYILQAKAFDLLGQTDNARGAYEKATLLAPAVEMHRRYPETADLARRYTPAPVPAEVMG
jgi:tetratricopeptide (TPR) repeat protein